MKRKIKNQKKIKNETSKQKAPLKNQNGMRILSTSIHCQHIIVFA